MRVLGQLHALPAKVQVVQLRLVLLRWCLEQCEAQLLDESQFVEVVRVVILDANDHGGRG